MLEFDEFEIKKMKCLVVCSLTCRSLMFEMTDSGCYHGDTMFVTVLE